MIRELTPDDAAALDEFLREHAETSVFLRTILADIGLAMSDHPSWSRFCAAFDENKITGVLAFDRAGKVKLQAPARLDPLCETARRLFEGERYPIRRISGPNAQVRAAVDYLGLADRPRQFDQHETLYARTLATLTQPPELFGDAYSVRRAVAGDRDLLIEWRAGFNAEYLHAPDNAEQRRFTTQEADEQIASGRYWILEREGVPVSLSGFNAAVPDMVQFASVWTPAAHRGKGYARLIVLASLIEAKRTGVRKAVLTTHNPGAAKLYTGIGFRPIGDYAIVVFEDAGTL